MPSLQSRSTRIAFVVHVERLLKLIPRRITIKEEEERLFAWWIGFHCTRMCIIRISYLVICREYVVIE